MSTHDLIKIKNFDDLLDYLRDQLDWPIDELEVDDLTYDYEPEELGIDPKNAAKIKEIKQLRPLDSKQPWGIFYIQFEPKQLPVTALRRILGQLVTRKRESANPADQKRWEQDDLLFISAYGEDQQRHIDFAHFADDAHNGLPTLRVLGWDAEDRKLKHDWVDHQLHEKLAWPDDEDVEEWRQRWRSAFVLRPRQVIETSKELAQRLAELARDIRARANSSMKIETENGPLRELMQAFQKALIHDLDEDGFADMYAQTIAYGLLSARISRPGALVADNLADMVPITNPFLKELMETFLNVGGRKWSPDKGKIIGIDFDELGVNDVVETLRDTNMEAVLHDFDNKNPQEDPVIHFYELFLKEYDAKKRMQRGVFYTPKPVVSYIVRSVHELLQTEFGLEDGLADTTTWEQMLKKNPDLKLPVVEIVNPNTNKLESKPFDSTTPFVQILDPATGTATFLVEVIDVIHRTMVAKWEKQGVHGELFLKQKWNEYVPKYLLPRIHGYEMMMAPYAIAHMKIGLKLYETGYSFNTEERARIYLTNALEPAQQFQASFAVPALAHEAEAVNLVKRQHRFTVVVGNPPYLGEAGTGGSWIAELMRGQDTTTGRKTVSYFEVDGVPIKERNSKWINDDYVKFTRLSHHLINITGCGIHGYISNHGYLDNPTFRGMRWALMSSFDRFYALDLHGSLKKKETPPNGGKDVNVFDIEQGVAIGLFVKQQSETPGIDGTNLHHTDVWGERTDKYDWLISHGLTNTNWATIDVEVPFYLFEPLDSSEAGDYFTWPAINDIFPTNSVGIVTARDELTIQFDANTVWKIVSDVANSEIESIREKYHLGNDVRDWKVSYAQADLKRNGPSKDKIASILYRPFDTRFTFYTDKSRGFLCMPRGDVMPHMIAGENLAIITARSNKFPDPDHFFASKYIVEAKCGESSTQSATFPLYLYPINDKTDASMFHAWPKGKEGRRPNLDYIFVDNIMSVIGLTFSSDGRGDLKNQFGPEDVLAYIYAVFHSPEYRRRFEPMLKLDFPRLPTPGASELFVEMVALGHELLNYHLLDVSHLTQSLTDYQGSGPPVVEKVSYVDSTVWLDKAQTRGFVGVSEEVWNFHIGGYQVCHKWLKDRQAKGGKNPRPGRKLTTEDITHYCKIVTAIHHTIRLMKEIDEVIEQHGGWPDAFVTEKSDS